MSSLSTGSSTRPAVGSASRWGPSPRRWEAREILLANLVVLGVAICFALLYRLAAALFILFVGIALGMAVKPGVDWVRRRGGSRVLAAIAIYTALGGVFVGGLVAAAPVVAEQSSRLIARAPHRVVELRAELLSSRSLTLRRIAGYLPAKVGATGDVGPGLDAGTVARYGAAGGRNVLIVAAVLLLGFYWTLEGERRTRALALFAPLERRRAMRAVITEMEHTVGAYLRGQALVCLIIGGAAFLIYYVVGLPHAPVLGLVYALGEAVPVIGPIIGTALAAAVALSVSPSLVLGVIAAAAFLQLFENYVLIPRIMDRVVGVNPLVTLLAISAFGSALGIAGAVMAIPMAAIVQLLLYRFLLDLEAERREPPVGRDRLSVVRYHVRILLRAVRKRARRPGGRQSPSVEGIEDALEGIAVDLDHILAERESRA